MIEGLFFFLIVLGMVTLVGHGIWVMLVRESDIAGEPDLLADFGIYGERATGVQELDDQSRTLRFILYFDPQNIESMVAGLRRVVELSAEERAQRAARGIARARTFTWERCVRQTVELLERLSA